MHRLALRRFFDRIAGELLEMGPARVLDFGCGEGLFLKEIEARGVVLDDYLGIDLREDALQTARSFHPRHRFELVDLSQWDAPPGSFDLVIASQVLEHLPDPVSALKRLVDLSSERLLLTVPAEPWFQIVNLARGRHLARLGNHPEHVNRWSFSKFGRLVSNHAQIVRAYRVFPFTVVVAKP
jgi:trans-aconitate methyltransferase